MSQLSLGIRSWHAAINISVSYEFCSLRMSRQNHIEDVLQIALYELCSSRFRDTCGNDAFNGGNKLGSYGVVHVYSIRSFLHWRTAQDAEGCSEDQTALRALHILESLGHKMFQMHTTSI